VATNGVDATGRNGSGDWTALRAWADAIARVGIPGAIALFVVYLGATQLPKLVIAVETTIVEIRMSRDLLREHMLQTSKQTWILQQTCWNSANGDIVAQRKCYE
jgi:hypothetical protein